MREQAVRLGNRRCAWGTGGTGVMSAIPGSLAVFQALYVLGAEKKTSWQLPAHGTNSGWRDPSSRTLDDPDFPLPPTLRCGMLSR